MVMQGLSLKGKQSISEINFSILSRVDSDVVVFRWRTDTYRSLTSSSDKVHLISADYRGFGYSTGSPDERGLITDGIALVKWAMEVAHISSERIVITGQSLGAAVAIAVAEHFCVKEMIDFKGIVLVAGFSDMPTLLENYAIGGFIPVLSPLRPYPRLQQFFVKRLQETWYSTKRLDSLVRSSKTLNLRMIHAKDDFEIPWTHSNVLFNVAANATSERGLSMKTIDALKVHQDFGESGFSNSWSAAEENCKDWKDCGSKTIRQDIVYHGGGLSVLSSLAGKLMIFIGHNRLATYPVVTKAILKLLLDI